MRKKRAIIYDDEPIIADVLSEFFRSFNYEVLSFNEPVVCPVYENDSDSCRNVKPCADLLITDVNMPRMSGIELILRQNQRHCKLALSNKAVMSGAINDNDKELISGLGLKFFHKPFSFAELTSWISECESRMDMCTPVGIVRKYHREKINMNVEYRLHSLGETCVGTITNISTCGLCLRTSGPIREDEIIEFNTSLPTYRQEATVKWVHAQPDSSYIVGLSCCDI